MRNLKFEADKKRWKLSGPNKEAEKKNFRVTGWFVFRVWTCDCVSMEEGRPLTSEALKGPRKGRGWRPRLASTPCLCPFYKFHSPNNTLLPWLLWVLSNKNISSLTDSAVWPSKPRSALTPKPVDSVHTDPSVITEREERNKKPLDDAVHPLQLRQSTSFDVCVCVLWLGS